MFPAHRRWWSDGRAARTSRRRDRRGFPLAHRAEPEVRVSDPKGHAVRCTLLRSEHRNPSRNTGTRTKDPGLLAPGLSCRRCVPGSAAVGGAGAVGGVAAALVLHIELG